MVGFAEVVREEEWVTGEDFIGALAWEVIVIIIVRGGGKGAMGKGGGVIWRNGIGGE